MKETSRNELRKFMEQYGADNSIGDLTPTVCALTGVEEPAGCGGAIG